jgi:hypothetical protein
MRRMAMLVLFGVICLMDCHDSVKPMEAVSKVAPEPLPSKTVAEVIALIKTAGPLLLKTFRPRMDFVEIQTQVTEQAEDFSVRIELQYHSFLKQNLRTAALSFLLSARGLVTQCRIKDPVKKATEVSCSQLEAKLSQLLAPSFIGRP